MMKTSTICTTALVISASSLIAIGFTLRRSRRWTKSREEREEVRLESLKTSLFFPCHFPENPNSSLQKFLSYLKNAKRKLQICVMTITFDEIIQLLKQKHEEGIRVQICTSLRTGREHDFRAEFKKLGIDVKSRTTAYSTQMHHKFVIIDDLIVMTGSLNWSQEAIMHQENNVLVTTDPNIVLKFSEQFQKIWKRFEDDPVELG